MKKFKNKQKNNLTRIKNLYKASKEKLHNVTENEKLKLIEISTMDIRQELKEYDKPFIKFLLENNKSFYINTRLLRYYMLEKGLTNKDIGNMLGKSVWTINRYFAQDKKIPMKDVFDLARKLDIPFHHIIDIRKYKSTIL